jgi:gamma-glutamylcyclotransferase (GGCT)/AIG2-like uncharacterized protein YtfP
MLPVERIKLFVYGTLKEGYERHVLLGDDKVYMGKHFIDGYIMIHCGEYPQVFHTSESWNRVHGEVYEISTETLAKLDVVEGVGQGVFARNLVNISNLGQCDIYVRRDAPDVPFTKVIGGEWRGKEKTATYINTIAPTSTYLPPPHVPYVPPEPVGVSALTAYIGHSVKAPLNELHT